MTSICKSYGLNKSNTNFYINEDIATSYDLYDDKGQFASDPIYMDQDGSKVAISATSNYTLLDCDATLQGWLKSDRQYAYSSNIYSSTIIYYMFTRV